MPGHARHRPSPAQIPPSSDRSRPGTTAPEGTLDLQDALGNQGVLEAIRGEGQASATPGGGGGAGGGGGPPDSPGDLPFRPEMEAAFGEDFSGVDTRVGAGAAVGAVNARALTVGEQVLFGDAAPDRETVAHELAHVVQQRRTGAPAAQRLPNTSQPGDAAEREAEAVGAAVASGARAPEVAATPTGAIMGDWLDDVRAGAGAVASGARRVASGAADLATRAADTVGDILDLRTDEARLDAEEELEEFRREVFADLPSFTPSSNLGQFGVGFDPAAGRLTITVKVFFEFLAGDPGRVAPGFRPEEFQWSGQEAAWKAQYLAEMSAAWSSPATGLRFRSTRPFWNAMTVGVSAAVVEAPSAADAHFVARVTRYPEDAAMVGSSVCGPGRHHAGGLCVANSDPATPANLLNQTASTVELDSNDLRPEQKLDWGNAVVAVPFRRGRTALDAAGRAALAPVVQQMGADGTTHAELTGRASSDRRPGADATAGAEENMDLARSRADAVVAELTSRGIGASRLELRNEGQQGAGAGEEWCRVDVQVGNRGTQVPAVHELGHMVGNGDQYTSGTHAAGAALPAAYDTMIRTQTGDVVTHQDDADVMSMGGTVRRWNYAPFLEALKRISGLDEWSL